MALINSLNQTNLKNPDPSQYALQTNSRLTKEQSSLSKVNGVAYDQESNLIKSANASMLSLANDPSRYVDNLPK